jgi:hypothetical protein
VVYAEMLTGDDAGEAQVVFDPDGCRGVSKGDPPARDIAPAVRGGPKPT